MTTLHCFRLFFCFAAALFFSLQAFAQTQAGAIKAAKVTGEVTRIDAAGNKTAVTEGQALIESDTIQTSANSGAVLVFMNGSSVNLSANSRLAIEEFKMDPLAENISVASLTGEPSVSKTKLNLAYGEMVGNVKKLNTSSQFDIKTPVGAAGIRGTTFRIVLIFQPNGQVAFTLSTSEGRVVFEGTVVLAGSGTTTEAGANQTVDVQDGQEVRAVATFDAATNVITVSQVLPVQPISASAEEAINTAVTQGLQQAAQTTVFTQTEQQQASQQTKSSTPDAQTSTQESGEQPKETPNQTTPVIVFDSTVRSGSG